MFISLPFLLMQVQGFEAPLNCNASQCTQNDNVLVDRTSRRPHRRDFVCFACGDKRINTMIHFYQKFIRLQTRFMFFNQSYN